ncbi:MAG: hypothetical protein AAGD07_09355 [Planctomycetota bacterium]
MYSTVVPDMAPFPPVDTFTDRTCLSGIVAHVGLHKTGTSALQCYLKEGNADYFVAHRTGYMDLVQAISSGKRVLISEENLSGHPFERDRGCYRKRFHESIQATHRVFRPEAYILGLREHSRFIESAYRQYLCEGGTLRFPEFIGDEGTRPVMTLEPNAWQERIESLQSLVGTERVFVYCQEDLAEQFSRVMGALEEFLGTRFGFGEKLTVRNRGFGVRVATVQRTCNRIDTFLRRARMPLLRGRATKMFGISSPQICRKWLGWIPQARDFFDTEARLRWRERYTSDWQYALSSRSYIQA